MHMARALALRGVCLMPASLAPSSTFAHAGWRTRALACWLALLVVLAPTLGRMHGVLHLPPSALLLGGAQVQAYWGEGHERSSGALAALFAHHAVLDCWQLEQLGHGHDQPHWHWLGASSCPFVPPTWQLVQRPLCGGAQSFDARAPPAACMV